MKKEETTLERVIGVVRHLEERVEGLNNRVLVLENDLAKEKRSNE